MLTKKMRFHTILFWIIMLLLTGCLSTLDESVSSQIKDTVDATSIHAIEDTLSTGTPIIMATIAPQIEPSSTPTPFTLTPTGSATISVTYSNGTPTPDANLTTELVYQCSSSEPVPVEETSLAQGLVLTKVENGTRIVNVLGDHSFSNLLRQDSYSNAQSSVVLISPDKSWVVYAAYNHADDVIGLNIVATDLKNVQSFDTAIEYDASVRFDMLKWLNSTSLITPINESPNLFEWLIWSPQLNDEKRVSLSFVGIEETVKKFQTAPVIDPSGEMVIYPCDQCNDIDFVVADLGTGEKKWEIDIGPRPPNTNRGKPVWSPNGEYVALIGIRDWSLNGGILIFRRDGTLLQEIVLPESDGILPSALTWSPDSSMLAFRHSTPGDEWFNYTLAYIEVGTGAVIDTCAEFPAETLYWSPDGTKMAFNYRTESEGHEEYITIVMITLEEIIQLYNPEAQHITGWLNWQE